MMQWLFDLLRGLICLVALQWFGNVISQALRSVAHGVAIPGPVFGMLMLLVVLLILRHIPLFLHRSCSLIFQFLPLLIIPTSVGVLSFNESLRSEAWGILTALTLSCLISFVVTPFVLQFFIRKFSRA